MEDATILILLAGWWIIGLVVVLNEMRHDMDVTISWTLVAVVLGLGGPFWLLKTLSRSAANIVLIKQATERNSNGRRD